MQRSFDGVQIQAGFHYLVNQFLNRALTIAPMSTAAAFRNGARFLIEIIEAVGALIDIRPCWCQDWPAMSDEPVPFVSTARDDPTFAYVLNQSSMNTTCRIYCHGADMADLGRHETPLSSLQGGSFGAIERSP